MPRTNFVQSAKKERRCTRCGGTIEVGQPYKWFKIKQQYGGIRKNYHQDCAIMPWERTTSPTRQHILMAQHNNDQALAALPEDVTLADIAQIVRDYAESVRELGEMKRESAENLESGFGHETYQSAELHEAADNCDSMADELDSTADDIESMDDPDADDDDFLEEWHDQRSVHEGDEEFRAYVDEIRAARRQEAIDRATEALAEEPEV